MSRNVKTGHVQIPVGARDQSSGSQHQRPRAVAAIDWRRQDQSRSAHPDLSLFFRFFYFFFFFGFFFYHGPLPSNRKLADRARQSGGWRPMSWWIGVDPMRLLLGKRVGTLRSCTHGRAGGEKERTQHHYSARLVPAQRGHAFGELDARGETIQRRLIHGGIANPGRRFSKSPSTRPQVTRRTLTDREGANVFVHGSRVAARCFGSPGQRWMLWQISPPSGR